MGQQRTDKEYQNHSSPSFLAIGPRISNLPHLDRSFRNRALPIYQEKTIWEKPYTVRTHGKEKNGRSKYTETQLFYKYLPRIENTIKPNSHSSTIFSWEKRFQPGNKAQNEISYQQCNENEYTIRRTNALQQGWNQTRENSRKER